MNVLGIMNGTSIDGIDIVLCRIDENQLEFIDHCAQSFPKALQKKLKWAAENDINKKDLSLLDYELGRFYANIVLKTMQKKKWQVDLIGLHGQTIFHQSGESTLQIGNSSFLAKKVRKPVVSDFRACDIALGGKGAPLAPIFHQAIARHSAVAFHNLGGISNLTYLGDSFVAFDTGPANLLMDLYMQKKFKKPYDKNGDFAAKGSVDLSLLKKLCSHPYFKQKPPKSCGREEFGEKLYQKHIATSKLKAHDMMATLMEFTAYTIYDSYRKFLKGQEIKTIYFCGGGAKNKRLLQNIQMYFVNTKVTTTEDLGWPVDAIEGGAFAYLAYLRWKQIPVNNYKFTGAKQEGCLGKIVI